MKYLLQTPNIQFTVPHKLESKYIFCIMKNESYGVPRLKDSVYYSVDECKLRFLKQVGDTDDDLSLSVRIFYFNKKRNKK